MFLSSFSYGLGYSCRSTDGYSVVIEHKLKKGRREPLNLTISQKKVGTLLTVGEDDIYQMNMQQFVEYATEGNSYVEASVVAIQIKYVDGRVYIPKGDTTTGNLVLHGKTRRLIRLTCFNYEKER